MSGPLWGGDFFWTHTVEMFELVTTVRQKQCIVVETDRKSIPSRRSSMTEHTSPYVDSLTRGMSSWLFSLYLTSDGRGGCGRQQQQDGDVDVPVQCLLDEQRTGVKVDLHTRHTQ